MWRHRGLVLLLAVALGAQSRGGRAAPSGRRGPPPPDAAARGLVQALFGSARADVAAVGPLAAPVITAALARDEMRLFPQQAIADYTAAFWLARALPLPASADPASATVEAIKAETERSAVNALLRPRPPRDSAAAAAAAAADADADADAALQLARRADVPKAPLYDPLVMRAAERGDAATGVALVQECARSDGTYPYRGLATALRSRRLDGNDRLLLAQSGLSYFDAGASTDQDADALFFLQAVRRETPTLAPEVESALQAVLSTSADPRTRERAAALLQAGGTGAVTQPSVVVDSTPGGGPIFRFSVTTAAPVAPESGESIGTSAFVLLVNRAQMLARSAPGGARDAANQADGMLNAALLAAVPDTAATLASVYAELGASADAARVLSLCLDAVDRIGAAADQTYANADSATRAAFVQRLDANAAAVIDVYSLAARLDPTTAATRAEASPMVLFKPLLLSRLAVVGQFPPAAPRQVRFTVQ
jgi:hypothetical protein